MRTFLLSLIIGAILCLFVGLVAFAPYHFTSVAMNDGLAMPFLNLDKPARELVELGDYDWKGDIAESEGDKFWDTYQLGEVLLELPSRHPLYLMGPNIISEGKTDIFGLNYLDHSARVLVEIRPESSIEWETHIGLDPIFNLPIFVSYLQKIGREQIWKDIFTREVVDPLAHIKGISDLTKVFDRSYEEMLYDLYILTQRERYLPKGKIRFALDEKGQGRIEIDRTSEVGEQRIYRDEWVYISRLGRIYRFHLRSRINNVAASVLRNHLLGKIEYKPSDPDLTKLMHARFQKLDLKDKIGQEGLTLLYCAWSHSPDQKEFLRELIQYSERGEKNEGLIGSLYNYAFKKYGTNFSQMSDKLLETASERLKRKMKEDEQKEIEAFKKSKDYIPEEFSSDEEKVEFFLNKARDDGDVEDKGVLEVP